MLSSSLYLERGLYQAPTSFYFFETDTDIF